MVPAYAGLGYAAFSVAMTVGRLTGDAVVRRVGRRQVVVAGGLCAAAGLALMVFVPTWQAGILGYLLLGAGSSNIVPVLFNAVGRQSTMPEHAAMPAVAMLGYLGILAGPAAIGFIAHASSLSASLLIVAALLFVVAASGMGLPITTDGTEVAAARDGHRTRS
jgi:MFS family permease